MFFYLRNAARMREIRSIDPMNPVRGGNITILLQSVYHEKVRHIELEQIREGRLDLWCWPYTANARMMSSL